VCISRTNYLNRDFSLRWYWHSTYILAWANRPVKCKSERVVTAVTVRDLRHFVSVGVYKRHNGISLYIHVCVLRHRGPHPAHTHGWRIAILQSGLLQFLFSFWIVHFQSFWLKNPPDTRKRKNISENSFIAFCNALRWLPLWHYSGMTQQWLQPSQVNSMNNSTGN
jgi:hypothetical protein